MLEHSIYPSPSKPATSPLCSAYYRYSSELSSSFCILSFLVRATSIDQTFYPATHYLAAVWLDSRHGPNTWSDSLSSLSCSKYWENELDISKDKAERSIAFSAAEIAACAKHQKEQQNWADAAQRLRDNKTCEETLWQTEIDEHDKQETIHHCHLNCQTRKKTEKLFIFELEVMNFKDQVDDSMLFISVCLHVN